MQRGRERREGRSSVAEDPASGEGTGGCVGLGMRMAMEGRNSPIKPWPFTYNCGYQSSPSTIDVLHPSRRVVLLIQLCACSSIIDTVHAPADSVVRQLRPFGDGGAASHIRPSLPLHCGPKTSFRQHLQALPRAQTGIALFVSRSASFRDSPLCLFRRSAYSPSPIANTLFPELRKALQPSFTTGIDRIMLPMSHPRALAAFTWPFRFVVPS
jgi:hypothetical protein